MFALPEPAQQFAGADGTAGLEAACRAAVTRRDREADGAFVYAVRTTGIYCRPSCASRPALPHNLLFFPSPEEAAAAGFRPCKRCKPGEATRPTPQEIAVTRACRMIEEAEEPPGLAQLAAALALSPHHFHRLFRRLTGVTPKAYAASVMARRAAAGITAGQSVTRAIYEAGFSSSSRFYETANARLGMSPSRLRQSGAGATIRFAAAQSSLGTVLVAATDRGICAIELGDEPERLLRNFQDRYRQARLIGGDAAFDALVAQVIALVEMPSRPAALPLHIQGTAFQQRVWQALRAIPPGATASYSDIARLIGASGAARAVARACATNALAVAIPCHRVIRTDGDPSGYRWGIERKRELLKRESSSCRD